jgi:hypothetical protein
MQGISWNRCGSIYGGLSLHERKCLRALRNGDSSECTDAMLEQFRTLNLICSLDGVHVLTDEGRAISSFC